MEATTGALGSCRNKPRIPRCQLASTDLSTCSVYQSAASVNQSQLHEIIPSLQQRLRLSSCGMLLWCSTAAQTLGWASFG
jgi:hypothetical protein